MLQIVLWDISAHEDRFQFNKPLQASDAKSTSAAMVRRRGGEAKFRTCIRTAVTATYILYTYT